MSVKLIIVLVLVIWAAAVALSGCAGSQMSAGVDGPVDFKQPVDAIPMRLTFTTTF
jgi:hypothetical protein